MVSRIASSMVRSLRMALFGVGLTLAPLVLGHCGGTEMNSDSTTVTSIASGMAPQDSAPNSNGSQVFFIGSDNRGPGVFRVGGTGGSVTELLIGAPLVQPQSLVVSSDDKQLYVADNKAGGKGALLVLDATTGAVVRTIAEGTRPRGVDTVVEGGADQIYFTGLDQSDGTPGLFRIRADGSALTVVAKGGPFSDPSGVVVTRSGEAYVTDTPGKSGLGKLLKVSGGVASEFQSGLWLGSPAGVSITVDEKTLLVSALNPATATDAVLVIDIATQGVTLFTQGISENTRAGGVHRSRTANLFTWADLGAGGRGMVYVINLR